MKKKRILDSEHAMLMKKSNKTNAKPNKNTGKEPKWKKQSEEFRNMLKGNIRKIKIFLNKNFI